MRNPENAGGGEVPPVRFRAEMIDCILIMMDFIQTIVDFILKVMDFIQKPIDFTQNTAGF